MTAPVPAVDPGPLPELAWLPVERLTVDHRYQRTLESRRSQKLVETIAAEFRWSSFQSILAAKTESGKAWLVIDGQHRVEAARQIGIEHVPAVVVKAATLAEQAAAFVRANTSRVSVNPFALHHARLAARDPEALAVGRICAAAGISIPRYPIPADKLKPGETMALQTIAKLPRRYGDDVALQALRTVAAAFVDRGGGVRAAVILAVAALVQDVIARDRPALCEEVTKFLAATAGDLTIRVMSRKQKLGGTEVSALASIIRDGVIAARPRPVVVGSFIASPSREQLMGRR